MSESEQPAPSEDRGAESPRLRMRPLGYRRSDVDEALAQRDAQLAELRHDIAALWIAFGQHDRVLRAMSRENDRAAAPAASPAAAPSPTALPSAPPPPGPREEDPDVAIESPEAIGAQLAGLDEVLAAIEAATHTLERSYADELAPKDPPPEGGETGEKPPS